MAKFFLLPLMLLVAISMVESSVRYTPPKTETLTLCRGTNVPSATPLGKIELSGLFDGSTTCMYALVTYSPYTNIKVRCEKGFIQLKTAAGDDYLSLVSDGSYSYSVDNRVYFSVRVDASGNIACDWEAY